MDHITLLGASQFASPYAMFVYVTLTEKGIPFQVELIDLSAGQHHQPSYRDQSLTAKIPLLTHNGFSLSESSAIIEYLDEAFPSPAYPAVLPPEIKHRARARQIQAWLRSDLTAIRAERPTEVIFFGKTYPPLADGAQREADKLNRAAQALLNHGEPNLFGSWSIADTELALMLNRLVLNGDEVPQRLADYAAAQWQRTSVQTWVNKKHD